MVRVVAGGNLRVGGIETGRIDRSVLDIFGAGDIRFVNLDGLTSGKSVAEPERESERSASMNALRSLEVDVVSCANDHYRAVDPLLKDLHYLSEVGIRYSGAGAGEAEAYGPTVVATENAAVAFFSLSSLGEVSMIAGLHEAGLALLPAETWFRPDPQTASIPGLPPTVLTIANEWALSTLTDGVRKAASRKEHVVVSMHWGMNGNLIADYQVEVARAVVDAGANLVLGHGPRNIQGVEMYKDTPIFYSIGSLLEDATRPGNHNECGLVVDADFGSQLFRVFPVVREERTVRRATEAESARVLAALDSVSGGRNATIRTNGGFGVIEVASKDPYL